MFTPLQLLQTTLTPLSISYGSRSALQDLLVYFKNFALLPDNARKLRKRPLMFTDALFNEKEKYKAICDDLDGTFAELTGY